MSGQEIPTIFSQLTAHIDLILWPAKTEGTSSLIILSRFKVLVFTILLLFMTLRAFLSCALHIDKYDSVRWWTIYLALRLLYMYLKR